MALQAPETHGQYRHALVLMHFSTLLFGLSALFGKLITLPATALVCGRGLFAVAALSLIFIIRRKTPWSGLARAQTMALAGSGLMLAVHFVTFFHAIKLGGIAMATLGFSSFPAFATMLEAAAFRELPRRGEVFFVALVTLGLALLPTDYSLASQATQGLLWGTGSGAVYAVLGVMNRINVAGMDGYQASWWQNGVILLCLLPFAYGELCHAPGKDWFWMACLGVLCSAVAYTFFVTSLRVIRARVAAVIISLEPVYAIAMDALLFREVLPPRVLVGGAIIILSVLLYPKSR